MKKQATFSQKHVLVGSSYFQRVVLKIEPCQSLSGHSFEVVYTAPDGNGECLRKTFADWVRRQIRKKEQKPPTTGMTLGHS